MAYIRSSKVRRMKRESKAASRLIADAQAAAATAQAQAREAQAELINQRDITEATTKLMDTYRKAVFDVSATVQAIKVPNGTTKKIARIVEAAIA